jgi:hypothetical protein
VDDEQQINSVNTRSIIDVIQTMFVAENILVAPMIYSIECVKDMFNGSSQ